MWSQSSFPKLTPDSFQRAPALQSAPHNKYQGVEKKSICQFSQWRLEEPRNTIIRFNCVAYFFFQCHCGRITISPILKRSVRSFLICNQLLCVFEPVRRSLDDWSCKRVGYARASSTLACRSIQCDSTRFDSIRSSIYCCETSLPLASRARKKPTSSLYIGLLKISLGRRLIPTRIDVSTCMHSQGANIERFFAI